MGMHFSTIKICLIWKLCYEAKNKRQAIKVFFQIRIDKFSVDFVQNILNIKNINLTWGTIAMHCSKVELWENWRHQKDISKLTDL